MIPEKMIVEYLDGYYFKMTAGFTFYNKQSKVQGVVLKEDLDSLLR